MRRPSSFGVLLRRARLAAGLTQAELAARAGLSARGVSDLERGERQRPHPNTVEMLAAALHLPPAARGAFERAARRATTPAVLPQLPSAVTSFVGRAQELQELIALLPTTRLLTLTGAGGVGKTRLAVEIARAAQADYPDGVWLVDLAAQADPSLAPAAVAAVLGVTEQPGRSLTATLTTYLADAQALLVLDNCERLVAACARLVAELLPVCPGLRVLATSRERLRVAGEVAWRVPSLGLPASGPPAAPDDLLAADAVRLFVERARAVERRFALTRANAPAVVEICRRLDGIPLAIELAAARAAVLSADQLVARLDDRFRLLSGDDRTAIPRHQTLRAVMDWSHALLAAAEQALLRRLAVFAGGFTLEAAEAVCGGPPVTGDEQTAAGGAASAEVVDLLARLVDKSLVQVDEPAAAVRYRLLETIRQYELERLQAAGEAAVTRARHAAWSRALAEQAEPALFTGAQVAWLARLEVEHDNLRAALAWCLDGDPAQGLRLAACLAQFWRLRGHAGEGRRWLDRLLQTAGATAPAAELAPALFGAGMLAYVQGDLAAARAQLERSVALSRAVGPAGTLARGLRELGGLLALVGERAAAWSLLEEGIALCRASGERGSLGTALQVAGWLAAREGDARLARALSGEAVVALRAVGDRLPLAFALKDLARVELSAGNAEQAEALLNESLALAEELGTPWQLAFLRLELGNVALQRGDLPRAAAHYEVGLRLGRRLDDHTLPSSLLALGRVALLQGNPARATALVRESLDLFTGQQDRQGIGDALHLLGLAAVQCGDAAPAATWLRRSLALRHRHGERLGVAACLEALARAMVGSDPAGAARLLGAAAALRQALGTPVPTLDRPGYAETVQVARATLGEAAFAGAWDQGRLEPLEQLIAHALADEPVS
jgi:non-specific serine/threonine protein kinase